MRILHINTARSWRGGEQQTFSLTQGLAQRGIETWVAAPPNSPLADRLKKEKLNCLSLPLKGEWDIYSAYKLAEFIKDSEVGLVHCHTAHAHSLGLIAVMISRKDIPVIVHRRVDFSIKLRGSGLFTQWKYSRRRLHFIAVSHAIKGIMEADGIAAGRISVVHSVVDAARFKDLPEINLRLELSLPPESLLIGNVAALVDHKAQKYLLEAAPQVLKKFPSARFIIVGEGDRRQFLERRANDLKLLKDRHVIFMGYRTDVLAIMKNFDVFVMASTGEGLGNAVMEAMVLGLPIVATTAGGIPEIVQDGEQALLARPTDAPELAKRIITLLSSKETAIKLGAAARQRLLAEFSVNTLVERTLEVYRQLLS